MCNRDFFFPGVNVKKFVVQIVAKNVEKFVVKLVAKMLLFRLIFMLKILLRAKSKTSLGKTK